MNESSVSPGWALVAIFFLWGLAGALDQPLIDEEPAEALPVERAKPVAPAVRLPCHVEPDESRAPWPPSRLPLANQPTSGESPMSAPQQSIGRIVTPYGNAAILVGRYPAGGAIAIATANRVLMLENAIYSVISPEAGASILWRDAAKAQDAANNMKITAADLLGFGVIDGVIPEPAGGAHRHPEEVMAEARRAIGRFLSDFAGKTRLELREHRREKFLAIGGNLG
mgnify:CR=1 FL=1